MKTIKDNVSAAATLRAGLAHRESADAGNDFRDAYLQGIKALMERRDAQLSHHRGAYMARLPQDRERYRRALRAMLGWPLTRRRRGVPHGEIAPVTASGGCAVYRLQIEVLPGVLYYGMLFVNGVPALGKAPKRPLVVAQHGGLGTPELISGLHGETGNYNDLAMRVFRRGAHVFAPQMLLWQPNDGAPYDRGAIDARLKQQGSSMAAVELHCLSASLDYLETMDCVDARHIGMIGLSYGGFYTLFAAAVDTRIQSAVSCAFFNDRTRYAWADWTWFGACGRFLDAEVGALVCPRQLQILVADNDELFDAEPAKAEFERLRRHYAAQGQEDQVSFTAFHGVHEYPRDDEAIDNMMRHLFA